MKIKVTKFVSLPKGDEEAMENALYNIGPLSIGVDANVDWQLYKKGISTILKSTCHKAVITISFDGIVVGIS